MTQCDILPYPLAIRPCHVIYGQPFTKKNAVNIVRANFRP